LASIVRSAGSTLEGAGRWAVVFGIFAMANGAISREHLLSGSRGSPLNGNVFDPFLLGCREQGATEYENSNPEYIVNRHLISPRF